MSVTAPGAYPVPTVADNLVSFTLPLWTPTHEDWVRAIGGMLAEVESYVNEQVDILGNVVVHGWGVLYDPDRCPHGGLGYLAQFVGERLAEGVSDDDARVIIKTQPNMHRGTPAAIARGAQKALTGTRIVEILPRIMPDGSADSDGDHFTVYTYADQTSDRDRVWQELLGQIPGGMRCNYEVVEGATWAGVEAGHASWASLEAEYPTWGAVRGAHPGATVWTW